jgi:hypothetical protein
MPEVPPVISTLFWLKLKLILASLMMIPLAIFQDYQNIVRVE